MKGFQITELMWGNRVFRAYDGSSVAVGIVALPDSDRTAVFRANLASLHGFCHITSGRTQPKKRYVGPPVASPFDDSSPSHRTVNHLAIYTLHITCHILY